MKCRAWGQESVRIPVIAGVCFSHFSMLFAGGMVLVRISRVSAIAGCSESRLYVECHVRMLTVTSSSHYLTICSLDDCLTAV